jgi:hypothetical protein
MPNHLSKSIVAPNVEEMRFSSLSMSVLS